MIRRLPALIALLACCAPAHGQSGPLVAESATARYALAAGEASFLDSRDPVSRRTFEKALGGDNPVLGALWSQIMAGAIQLRREDEAEGETLWFNPLFDAGLATRWALGTEGWQAVAAVPVTGEMLRGETFSAEPVGWKGGALDRLLADKARATWRASTDSDWFAVSAQGAGTVAMVRALAGDTALDRMRAAPGYAEAIEAAWRALTQGDEAALPDDVQQGLYATGFRARTTLRPVAAFQGPGGWIVAMQSPDAPRLAWLARFADPPGEGEKAAFRGYELVDLGAGL